MGIVEIGIATFVLLIVYQIKHFLIDFPLQANTKGSLGKFNEKGWVKPLAVHTGHHAIGTFMIAGWWFVIMLGIEGQEVYLYYMIALGLALFDFVVHFTMDRIKASPYLLGRFKYPDKWFFYSLGIDQSVHHCTHYAIIAALVYVAAGVNL